MIWSLLILGSGSYLVSSLLNSAANKASAQGKYATFKLFGAQVPQNVAVTALSMIGLFLNPLFGGLAGIVGLASTLGAIGGTVSILNSFGVNLIPASVSNMLPGSAMPPRFPGALQGDVGSDYYGEVIDLEGGY
jgi:hypothetical protein